MAEARKERMADKARDARLQTGLKEKLVESRKLLENREENRREFKEKILEDILKHRLWMSEEEIVQKLTKRSKTRATSMLKNQIHFRVDILECEAPAKLSYPKATIQEMTNYLINMLTVDVPDSNALMFETMTDPNSIVGFEFNQK